MENSAPTTTVTPNANPQPQTNPTTNPPPQASPTFRQNLDAGEQHWIWKLGLRAFTIIVAIVGIGCIGWAVSTAAPYGPYTYELDDRWSIVWSLITFGISLIWCSVCIAVFLLRRHNAPVHPGVAVGIDLVLWLAFIVTTMFALIGALSVLSFGSDGTIGQYSSYGYYTQAPNGTWVWNATEHDTYHHESRDCTGDSSNYDGYGFSSCAAEDTYVNQLWNSSRHRAGVELTGVVCQFLGLLLHLTLFIWACVDTARRNRRQTSKEAERLAAEIVMNMVKNGAVVQHPAGMQQYPQYQQHWGAPIGTAISQPPMAPQQAVTRGDEKGQSARFA